MGVKTLVLIGANLRSSFSEYICAISVGKKAKAKAEAKYRIADFAELLKKRFLQITRSNVPASKVLNPIATKRPFRA
jgi:hypothetical protein